MCSSRATPPAPPYRLRLAHWNVVPKRFDDKFWVKKPIARAELEYVCGAARKELRRGIHIAVRRPEKELEHRVPDAALHLAPGRLMTDATHRLAKLVPLGAHFPIEPHHILGACLSISMHPTHGLATRFCKSGKNPSAVALVYIEIEVDDARVLHL